MASAHSPADDVVYNLVSIQYHALKGAEVYDRFIDDAHGHGDVVDFIRQVQTEDAQRAIRCHELLGGLTKGHGIG
ncbi:MAG: hypothetical protein ACR2G7_11325 [Acidimicrobiales bacterium]